MSRILDIIRLAPQRMLISVTNNMAFRRLMGDMNPRRAVFHLVPGATVSRLRDVALVSDHGTDGRRRRLVLSVFGRLKLTVLVPRDRVTTAATLASYNVTCILGCVRTTVRTNVRLKVCPGSTRGVITRSIGKTTSLVLGGSARPDIRVSGIYAPNNVAVGNVGRLSRRKFSSTVVGTVGTYLG